MCGISGVYWGRSRPPVEPGVGVRMADALFHRGPDSAGHCETPFADIGFRRLAIIDLSTGDQPLANEDGSVECFLNGEIYNYKDLRAKLERLGHVFKTTSDTEVIPHLYEEYGTDMFAMLNGMFAICVIDHRQRQLILARDQIGLRKRSQSGAGIGPDHSRSRSIGHPELSRAVLRSRARYLAPRSLQASSRQLPAPR